MKKKILGITTIRSDYDLMSGLYIRINADDNFTLKLIVAGAHLSSSYGESVELIKKDGLKILLEIETLINSDTRISKIKSASLLLQNSIETIKRYNPDLIIFAGDREDTIISAMIGSFLHIPTAHFYGGDHVMDGNVDNPIRHAVSKLSSFHFVSTKVHFDRLISIGENIDRIYNIGSMALDNFKNHQPMPLKKIISNFSLNENFTNFCLLIFHPLDLEWDNSSKIFQNILKVLNDLNVKAFVSYPNTDPGNQKIISVIKKYYSNENFKFFKNLPRDVFLSIYKNSKFLIGNSSSGIIEAASIPLPVINVGERQKNRDQSGNVLFCKTKYEDIYDAVNKVNSNEFRKNIKNIKNIYGDGMSVEKAFSILKKINFSLFTHKTEDPLKVME